MIKRIFYIIFLLSTLVSCTSTKNTGATRFYHAVNTRYNIYFNGNEAYKEALKAQNKGHQESYSDMILMYPVSALPKDKQTEGGAFDRAIEKSAKAIKRHSIKTKPKKQRGKSRDPEYQRYMNREEYNPFMHNAWLLMGKAQFHNGDFLVASSTFSYITRHYANDDPAIVYEAKLWQARCYSELGWLYEAEDIFRNINNEALPNKLVKLFSSFYADYLIKSKDYKSAVPYLNTAIKAEKDKTQKNRMKYLLGQIYQSEGNQDMAYKTFDQVAGSSAPYPLVLSAKIRQTETYTGGNSQKMIKKLKGMSRSSKNKEYLDQVYYALGNVYLSVPDTLKAIESYLAGVEASTRGGMDKALCQIQLGDLYFVRRDYVAAQPCYSEAAGILNKEHKDYQRVSKRSEILDELVVNHEAVVLQDSLQRLAAMPEAERLAVINKIIEDLKKKEEEEKEKANREEFLAQQEDFSAGLGAPGGAVQVPTMPTLPGESSFYFYNAQTVAAGKTNFQSRWGRRKLEDNWRRRNKVTSGFENLEEPVDPTNTQTEPTTDPQQNTVAPTELSTDNKDPKFYLQQLPLTEEDITASNTIIKDGLFNMGVIFKDKLEDMPLAIETFDKLNSRFPGHEFLLKAYYHLYLVYLRLQNTQMAELYKSKIRAEFPESELALAMADPNYEYNVRMMDVVQDSIYEATYKAYLEGNVSVVRQNYQLVQTKYAQTQLMPKFMFIHALTYIQTRQPDDFKRCLKELLEKYPETDVGVLAGDIMKGLLSGRQLSEDGSPMKGLLFNIRFGAGEEGFEPDSTLQFSPELNTPHTLMLVYPTGSVNENLLLFNVAAYNFSNFVVKEFDLSFESFGQISMMQVKSFTNFEEIMQYYSMIYAEGGYARALDSQVIVIPISTDNYDILTKGKSLDEYLSFFEEQFGKTHAALVKRWKLRQEAEEQSLEETDEKTPEEVPVLPADSIAEELPSVEVPADTIVPVISPALPEVQEEKKDTLIAPVPIITEDALEEGVSKAAQDISEGADKLNKAVDEFTNDPFRGIMNLFKKKEKNAIDEYVEQQEKEEKERQKALSEQQKEEQKLKLQQQKEQEKARRALLKQQQEEERAILKAKEAQEKELERLKKLEEKQKQDEKKRLAKEKEDARKLKEQDYKARQKQKAEDRKERDRLRKEENKRKEAERKVLRKQKEEERKARAKQKEAERKARAKK